MSTWIPPAVPPVLETLWLPIGYTDVSITPHTVSCLETSLEKCREEVRKAAAPIPMGVTERSFQSAGVLQGELISGGEAGDEDMEVDEGIDDDDDDEMLSDDQSDDGEFGTVGSASLRTDEQIADVDDGTDDEFDDDDLDGYL